jgi:hypothetical protein
MTWSYYPTTSYFAPVLFSSIGKGEYHLKVKGKTVASVGDSGSGNVGPFWFILEIPGYNIEPIAGKAVSIKEAKEQVVSLLTKML